MKQGLQGRDGEKNKLTLGVSNSLYQVLLGENYGRNSFIPVGVSESKPKIRIMAELKLNNKRDPAFSHEMQKSINWDVYLEGGITKFPPVDSIKWFAIDDSDRFNLKILEIKNGSAFANSSKEMVNHFTGGSKQKHLKEWFEIMTADGILKESKELGKILNVDEQIPYLMYAITENKKINHLKFTEISEKIKKIDQKEEALKSYLDAVTEGVQAKAKHYKKHKSIIENLNLLLKALKRVI